MIGKHVSCKVQNDDYGRLARYIADAGHEGEKCLVSWSAGCWSGDDYDMGIVEAEAVQDLNTRSAKEKTYHLLISFRPEDEAKLAPEAFRAIEERFAQALGFAEHQRHCGVHKNTNNLHLHVAYNMYSQVKFYAIHLSVTIM
ncbi:MAG: relaxase/mobilization nuclease domain-containing protein [Dehalococcoidia bacterium]|nr:relaxase/mobilization nuclease domain-containing protein [Dehalococcoidia bacterium]